MTLGATRFKKYWTVRFLLQFYWEHYKTTVEATFTRSDFVHPKNQQNINRLSWNLLYMSNYPSSICFISLSWNRWLVGVL